MMYISDAKVLIFLLFDKENTNRNQCVIDAE